MARKGETGCPNRITSYFCYTFAACLLIFYCQSLAFAPTAKGLVQVFWSLAPDAMVQGWFRLTQAWLLMAWTIPVPLGPCAKLWHAWISPAPSEPYSRLWHAWISPEPLGPSIRLWHAQIILVPSGPYARLWFAWIGPMPSGPSTRLWSARTGSAPLEGNLMVRGWFRLARGQPPTAMVQGQSPSPCLSTPPPSHRLTCRSSS